MPLLMHPCLLKSTLSARGGGCQDLNPLLNLASFKAAAPFVYAPPPDNRDGESRAVASRPQKDGF